ncbi:MAG: hypothetical protein IPK80_35310 [Nannocystis sp.]|nr:hypothetical protein [Nannocystis sp.]
MISCGDGEVSAFEECDDGNADNTDMCTDACTNALCGDGFVQPGPARAAMTGSITRRTRRARTCARSTCAATGPSTTPATGRRSVTAAITTGQDSSATRCVR